MFCRSTLLITIIAALGACAANGDGTDVALRDSTKGTTGQLLETDGETGLVESQKASVEHMAFNSPATATCPTPEVENLALLPIEETPTQNRPQTTSSQAIKIDIDTKARRGFNPLGNSVLPIKETKLVFSSMDCFAWNVADIDFTKVRPGVRLDSGQTSQYIYNVKHGDGNEAIVPVDQESAVLVSVSNVCNGAESGLVRTDDAGVASTMYVINTQTGAFFKANEWFANNGGAPGVPEGEPTLVE